MNCADWREKLQTALDGELSAAGQKALSVHLSECAACRAQVAALQDLRAKTLALPNAVNPSRELWPEIQAQLNPSHLRSDKAGANTVIRHFRFSWAAAGIAATLVLLGAVGSWQWRKAQPPSVSWEIASLAGTPRVGRTSVSGNAQLRVGEWLETDASSRAKVAVGSIGEVRIEPNSRLRLQRASATDHRLELARGELHALIWAPPRLFFVETPSATAVDLGCEYTLNVDERGNGLLQVLTGYVALEHRGRESIIPAGRQCETRSGQGPGTPFASDASPALRRALEQFDFERGGSSALETVLHESRAEDAITLWHLLDRTRGDERGKVFASLAQLSPPPEGVTRDGILQGDATMRRRWGTAVGLNW